MVLTAGLFAFMGYVVHSKPSLLHDDAAYHNASITLSTLTCSYNSSYYQMPVPPKHEATAKLMKYCAYQERCMSQVQEKLKELEVEPDMAKAIFQYLLAEGYVNEARFTSSFVRGKYNHAGWGRKKIAYKLRQLRVPDALISETLEAEIDDELYCQRLQERIDAELLHAQKKKSTWSSPAQRVAQKLYTQGYESELIWQYIRKSPLAKGLQMPED